MPQKRKVRSLGPEHGDGTLVAQLKRFNKTTRMAINLFSITCHQPKGTVSYKTYAHLSEPFDVNALSLLLML